MSFDACIVGHVTKDIIRVDGAAVREIPGGTAYYTSLALNQLGLRVAVVTKVAKRDRDRVLADLQSNGVVVFCHDSAETTVFENIYRSDNLDHRLQKVHALASPFSPEEVADIDASLFHFGPLTNQDLPCVVLGEVAQKGYRLSLDAQGYVRRVKDGEVREARWQEREQGLQHIHILKANEREALILSGEADVEKAARSLARLGPQEVIITRGSRGSLLWAQGQVVKVPAMPARTIVDATGCGDIYMAGYLYQRLRSTDVAEAVRFATALATRKLERFGP